MEFLYWGSTSFFLFHSLYICNFYSFLYWILLFWFNFLLNRIFPFVHYSVTRLVSNDVVPSGVRTSRTLSLGRFTGSIGFSVHPLVGVPTCSSLVFCRLFPVIVLSVVWDVYPLWEYLLYLYYHLSFRSYKLWGHLRPPLSLDNRLFLCKIKSLHVFNHHFASFKSLYFGFKNFNLMHNSTRFIHSIMI